VPFQGRPEIIHQRSLKTRLHRPMRTQDPLVVRNRRSHRFAHSPESPIVASGLRPRGWVYFSWDLAPRPTICSIKKQRPTRGERDLTPLPSLRFTPTRIETFPGLLEYSDQLQAVRHFSLNNGVKALNRGVIIDSTGEFSEDVSIQTIWASPRKLPETVQESLSLLRVFPLLTRFETLRH